MIAEIRNPYGAKIDFDKGTLKRANELVMEDYFCKYLCCASEDGMKQASLEYTTNPKLIRKNKEYCKEQDFIFTSSSLELR